MIKSNRVFKGNTIVNLINSFDLSYLVYPIFYTEFTVNSKRISNIHDGLLPTL